MSDSSRNDAHRGSDELWQLRVDLAAAHRIAAVQGFTESIYNHFTAVSPEIPGSFLALPFGYHWSEVTASSLLEVSFDGEVKKGDGECERSAFCIHAPIHQARPDAVAVFHTHMPYASALTRLADMTLKPAGQTEASIATQVAYDENYQGYARSPDEGRRLADAIGDKNILLMGNHGVLVLGETIAQAYHRLYYLERAAQVQIYAQWTGQPLRNIPDTVLEKTRKVYGAVRQYGGKTDDVLHFEALKRLLKGPPAKDFDE